MNHPDLQEELKDKMGRPPESKFATEYGDPCARFRVMRVEYGNTQEEWADAVGVDPSKISRIESGQHFPNRTQLLEWTKRLGLAPEDEDGLLISAGYLPRLPEGFGTSVDRALLGGAIRELVGKEQVPFIGALQARMAKLG